jgi:hypothetical protein
VVERALPTRHLTARVPWHDTAWDGRICRDPKANLSCLALKNISEKKDAGAEAELAERSWDTLAQDQRPPCVVERAGWLRPYDTTNRRPHPYDYKPSHKHLLPTEVPMPAWSMMATPFRWMLRENAATIAAEWGLVYDQSLEESVDAASGSKPPSWVQHHENQQELLDAFFSAIRGKGESLLFVYAKDLPLVEAEPGARFLVGVTTVERVHPTLRYREAEGGGPTGSVFWERPVQHRLRPRDGDGWDGGVLLPYHQLLQNPELEGTPLDEFIAAAPPDRFLEYSYASEHLPHDGAVDSLIEIARALRAAAPFVTGSWANELAWLDEQISRVWEKRGAYPGIGPALSAAGIEHGTLVAHEITQDLPADADPWPVVYSALEEASQRRGPLAGRVGAGDAHVVVGLPSERKELLQFLSRMDLSPSQARRFFRQDVREAAGVTITDRELLGNPWLVFELDRDSEDPVSFRVADRALMVDEATARRHPIEMDPPLDGRNDIRRVRAAMADQLELVGRRRGDTLMPQSQLAAAVNEAYEPSLDITSDLLAARGPELAPTVRPAPMADRSAGWQIDRLAEDRDLIRSQILARVERARPFELDHDWQDLVRRVIGTPLEPGDQLEEQARQEKAEALRKLATQRFSVLVGPAGTGKTTLVRALRLIPEIENDGILLLAPTGKAVVQLTRATGLGARTIAGFLMPSGRYDPDSGLYRRSGGSRSRTHATIVIDEASMVTEPMLAAVLDSVSGVKRLILAGDPRQLPPIGEGRPFYDAVALAREQADGASHAALTIVRRQSEGHSGDPAQRDDLRLAAWFASDAHEELDDSIWARLMSGDTDRTVAVAAWDTQEELIEIIASHVEQLVPESLQSGPPHDRLFSTYGFQSDGQYVNPANPARIGEGVESWQILSPVRHRTGGVAPLNALVQERWLSDPSSRAELHNRRSAVVRPNVLSLHPQHVVV